jgi:primosomal protein N' (replication factor Y)
MRSSLACQNCDAWLVDHRFKRRLVCHHCGFSMPPPEKCPKCEAAASLVACGPGVERLEEEVAALFPERASGALDRSRRHGRAHAPGA